MNILKEINLNSEKIKFVKLFENISNNTFKLVKEDVEQPQHNSDIKRARLTIELDGSVADKDDALDHEMCVEVYNTIKNFLGPSFVKSEIPDLDYWDRKVEISFFYRGIVDGDVLYKLIWGVIYKYYRGRIAQIWDAKLEMEGKTFS